MKLAITEARWLRLTDAQRMSIITKAVNEMDSLPDTEVAEVVVCIEDDGKVSIVTKQEHTERIRQECEALVAEGLVRRLPNGQYQRVQNKAEMH